MLAADHVLGCGGGDGNEQAEESLVPLDET